MTRPPQPTATGSPTPPRPPPATSLFPPITTADRQRGPAEASLTIIEYGDYQCLYCAQLAPILTQLLEAYPDDVRLIYRHFPLADHDKARLAAEAAEAAGAQGKFWEMHDLLYALYPEWAGLSPADFRDRLDEYAAELGLEAGAFESALNTGAFSATVEAAYQSAATINWQGGTGLPVAPFLIVNDQPYQGPLEYRAFDALVRLERLSARQFAEPVQVIDPIKTYLATLRTNKGDFTIELFTERAPVTVNNFIFLAQNGWFEGVTFHYVISGFVAQTGDPSGTGFGGPGYFIPDEISPDLSFDRPGVVGMYNIGPNTNGSQFFIILAPLTQLDGRYTIFGQVIQGLEVVQRLTPRDVTQKPDAPPGDQIISITITEE